MIQAYSNSITVDTAASVPFNSVALVKGCSVEQQNLTTFIFNRRGIYLVSVDATGNTSGTSGNIALQLYKNGIARPEAFNSAASTAVADVESLSFETLVQVEDDNALCRCNKEPTTIQIQNTGVAAQFEHINIVITKRC